MGMFSAAVASYGGQKEYIHYIQNFHGFNLIAEAYTLLVRVRFGT